MVLVLYAHPYPRHSRVGKALLHAIEGLPDVAVRPLYELYPDFSIDVAAEQAALMAAHTIVWQHPMYWYHTPALLTLWFEKVLALNWAYGTHRALEGKRVLWVTSTGGPREAYLGGNGRLSIDELSAPLRQTAAFCGMRWLPPHVVHHAAKADAAQLLAHGEAYRDRIVAELRVTQGGNDAR